MRASIGSKMYCCAVRLLCSTTAINKTQVTRASKQMNCLFTFKSAHALSLSLTMALSLSLTVGSNLSALAQEETSSDAPDASMDSMWEEGNKSTETKKTAIQSKSTKPSEEVPQASQSRQDLMDAMSSPLCQLSNFKESELVRTTCWPGVGPFKADGNSTELTDPQDNKLNVQVDGDKLTSAQLLLVGQSQDAQGILNLEMVSDFMLEALGLKGKRITEFNTYLEKNKEILTADSKYKGATLSTASGPYVISLKGSGAGNNPSYLIEVHSKSISPDQVKSHDLTALLNSSSTAPKVEDQDDDTTPVTPIKTQTQTGIAVQNNTSKKPPVVQSKTPVKTVDSTTSGTTKTTTPVKPVAATEVKTTQATQPVSSGSEDGIKKELGDAIRAWQQHKKMVLRERQAGDLSKYLTGRALINQTSGVKWLIDHQNYYEMTPKGVTVSSIQKLSDSPKRYSVIVNVKEASKQIKEPEKTVIKSTDDSYNVNYTLEKAEDTWRIADYKLLSATKK
jgi:hypothetical protein